jgi:hypothetical protein
MLGFTPMAAAPLASLGLAIALAGDAGSYAVTGQDVTWGLGVGGGAGAYTLTGQDAELDPSLFFRCQTGDFYLTGQPAAFRLTRATAAGAYTVTGQDATLGQGLTMPADAGAVAVTGQPAIFRIGVALIGAAGAYHVNGQPTRARYVLRGDAAALGTGGPQPPLASAPMASLGSSTTGMPGYGLTGQVAALKLRQRAAAGAYVLTGQSARLVAGPIYRARAVDGSGAAYALVDGSWAYYVAWDTSEGAP